MFNLFKRKPKPEMEPYDFSKLDTMSMEQLVKERSRHTKVLFDDDCDFADRIEGLALGVAVGMHFLAHLVCEKIDCKLGDMLPPLPNPVPKPIKKIKRWRSLDEPFEPSAD